MSARELTRVEVLARVKAGTLSSRNRRRSCSTWGTARRSGWCGAIGREGAKRLRHGSAGRRSNHARPATERARILAVVRAKYSGSVDVRFGPTLAAVHLWSEDGIPVHHDTLRRWMLIEGLWSRARRRAPHRARRARKAHFGELVQLDRSFHDVVPGMRARAGA